MTAVIVLLAALIGSAYLLPGQYVSPPSWQREEKSDPLHNLNYSQFTLQGKYLIPPKSLDPSPPVLVVRCQAGNHRYGGGYLNGKFLAGYLAVDAVLDFRQGRILTEFKLDNGKLQQIDWTRSTDGSGVFFSGTDIDNLLYGHFLPRKENTNAPIQKVIIGVPEYLGAEIEAEFDMPEPSDVSEVCGVIVHKK